MKRRGYNFCAGPAMLPLSILQEAQKELLNWQQTGMSVMEIGHRTSEIQDLMAETEVLFKEALSIPEEYHVLMLGGAARTQFAMLPLNAVQEGQSADYIISGIWSKMALEECRRLSNANCAATNEQHPFSLPEWDVKASSNASAYLYYTSNETINGIQFSRIPESKVPLVCDMTSSLLSEPVPVEKYALIFAGAQKNIANAGMTVIIVSDQFLKHIPQNLKIPTMMDYRVHAKYKSLYATPPVFNCYMANKMLHWVKANGGVAQMQIQNRKKSTKLYQYIDESSFYHCPIQPDCRSLVNVCFRMKNTDLEKEFLKGAEKNGLFALSGHRMVGGMRASIYNAMPEDGVDALLKYMHKFAKDNT